MQDFRRRYNEVVRGCPVNHTRVDYLMARAERTGRWETKAWAHLRYVLDVYGLYGACLLGPPLVLLFFAMKGATTPWARAVSRRSGSMACAPAAR